MIDKVLILGLRRAGSLIPSSEILQMIGRCGRSYTESGEATLVVSPEDEEEAYCILSSKPSPILSGMWKLENLSFHFLPEIKRLGKVGEKDFLSWYSRSLAGFQNQTVSFEELMEFLKERECVLKEHSSFLLSDLGVLACDYYFSPSSAFQIASRVRDQFFQTSIEPIDVSWILSYEKIFKDLSENMGFQEYLSNCQNGTRWFEEGQSIHGYALWCVLTNHSCKLLGPEIISIRKDLKRLFGFLKGLFILYGKDQTKTLEKILISSERRIPLEMADLAIAFPEAKKSILFELESFGVDSLESLKEKEYQIEHYGSRNLKIFLEGGEYCKSKTRKSEEGL